VIAPLSSDAELTTLAIDTARGHVAQILESFGVPVDEAAVGARVCIDAEMLGRRSHGIRLVRNISREYERGARRRGPVVVERETAVSASIDGGFHLSPWLHDLAARLAAKKAVSAGVGIVAVRNAGVSGALGVHTLRMAHESGVVALAINGSPSVVVAPGTAIPTLGSNPLSVAIPRSSGLPVVLDMATSSIAFNAVVMARAAGERLPDGVAVDERGVPTTDPASAVTWQGHGRLLPFGGHRGFGLSLMIELLVAGGVSGIIGQRKITDFIPEPDQFPGIYLAYQPEIFGGGVHLDASIDQLLAELSAAEVRVPGQQSLTRYAEAVLLGHIRVPPETIAVLREFNVAGALATDGPGG
jgi:LDH2 family malate/lactate/ureidoglycolate dehydrogenase